MSNQLLELFKSSPIADEDTLRNLQLFTNRIDLADILFMAELYKKQLNVHGVIAEFGSRWGRNLALFEALRSIYEPYNHIRKIIGFDTFEGFAAVSDKDGQYEGAKQGGFNVSQGYEIFLEKVLAAHEAMAPIADKKKFELVKGDICETLPQYLQDHPHTIFSMIYIDVDLYEPTKEILKHVKNHIVKGTVIGFDEVCHPNWPGETIALRESFDLQDFELQRLPFSPTTSYIVC